ncbi:type II secretion system protein N [Polymorphobacter sp.]|uniref:type II secretion system protein N n=1 Tax=Polymorphobacter sp. TaxID=1909290 RepID=UPI003F6F5CB1
MSIRPRALLFVLALIILSVWLLPLRLVLGDGLAAASVSGRVWDGRVAAAQWRGLGLGDLAVAVASLSVFAGAPRVTLDGPQLRGTAGPGWVQDLSGSVIAPGLGPVRLEAVSLRFEDEGCREASGRLLATVAGEPLAGALGCDGPAARAAMARADGVVVATLRLNSDGALQVTAP